jgi:hypothetical protein
MQKSGFRVWYDSGIEVGTEWPQYIAEHLAEASCVMMFMSPNMAESHNCRNEINLASELKKEMLVVHLKDFEPPLGLKLLLNLSQAIYKPRFKKDADFLEELGKATILQKYKEGAPVSAEPKNEKPKKSSPKSKALIAILCGFLAIVLALFSMGIFGKDSGREGGSNVSSNEPAAESVVCEYSDFQERLSPVLTTLQCADLWDPSDLIDNLKINQGDDKWVTYFSDNFATGNTSLHIGFRNNGTEIIAVLNSFGEQDLDKAYKLIECMSSAVYGFTFTDFAEVMSNDNRVPWKNRAENTSIWKDVLDIEEPAFSQYDGGSEMKTQYKQVGVEELVICVERRTRIHGGEKRFDFTILYEHTDNIK